VNCIVNIFTKNEYTKMAYAMPIRLSVAVFWLLVLEQTLLLPSTAEYMNLL
jgi:hypothetical protein